MPHAHESQDGPDEANNKSAKSSRMRLQSYSTEDAMILAGSIATAVPALRSATGHTHYRAGRQVYDCCLGLLRAMRVSRQWL